MRKSTPCRATVWNSFTDEFNDYMTKLSDGFRGGKGGQKGMELEYDFS